MSYKIASGIKTSSEMDSVAALTALPPQFPPDYQSGGRFYGLRSDRGIWTDPSPPYTFFREAEAYLEAGDRHLVAHGAPMAQWYFRFWTDEQVKYWRLTFCTAPAHSATVTIRTLHPDGTWGDWYGVMHFPKPNEDMGMFAGGWENITVKFVGLRACA